MRICIGGSRIVLLIGTRAIKFASFGVHRTPKHIWWWFSDPCRARGRYEQVYRRPTISESLLAYLMQMTFGGIRANRQEYQISRSHPELPVAPVLSIHAGGLILIMERGTPADETDACALCSRYPGADLDLPKHVCLVRGSPRYIDYGHPDAPHVLGIA